MSRWFRLGSCLIVFASLMSLALSGCTSDKKDNPAKAKDKHADEHGPTSTPTEKEPKKSAVSTADLYRTPGGIYTEADIKANGDLSPKEKFKKIGHQGGDTKEGEKICPISNEKANPEVSWVIQGQRYEFCCPPCVDRFLKLAHNDPSKVKDAAAYVKEP